eukprot:TRINITY_DN41920_c0_g1_i1.p1 TRINITY_DN41920_c0_g1~~TRINITY_DN41920_c0_g1_i1.p1  ORF type:complete len:1043 (+),score=153.05 TRINITY_DN41920_c0_g1_i1:91-3219(+)
MGGAVAEAWLMRLPPPKAVKENLGHAMRAAISPSVRAGTSYSQAGLGHAAHPIHEKLRIYPPLLAEPPARSPRTEPVAQSNCRAVSTSWVEQALTERSARREPATDLAYHCSARADQVVEMPGRHGGRQLPAGRAAQELEQELVERISRLENFNACLLRESTEMLMRMSSRSRGASSDGKMARTQISPTRRQIAPTRGAPGHEWVGNTTRSPCFAQADLQGPCQAATREGGSPPSRSRWLSEKVTPVPESHVSMITAASEMSYRAASPPPSLPSGELRGQMEALRYQIRQSFPHTESITRERVRSATADSLRLAEEFEALKKVSPRGISSDPAKPTSMQCSASSEFHTPSHQLMQENRSPLIHLLSPSQSSHSVSAFNRAAMEDDMSAPLPWHEKGRLLLAKTADRSTSNRIVSRPSSRDNIDRAGAATTAASASHDRSEGRSLQLAADASKFNPEAFKLVHAEPQTAQASGCTSQKLYRRSPDLRAEAETAEPTNGVQSSPKVIAGAPSISPEKASPAQHVLGQLSPVQAASVQQSPRLSPFSTSSARDDLKLATPRGGHRCAESVASEFGSGKSVSVSELRSLRGYDDISFVSAILSSGKGVEPEISAGRSDKLYSFSDQMSSRAGGPHHTTSTKAISPMGKAELEASDMRSWQFNKRFDTPHSLGRDDTNFDKTASPPRKHKLDSAVSEARNEKALGPSKQIHFSVRDNSTSPKAAASRNQTQDHATSPKAEDAWQTLSERTKIWAEELAQSRDRVALRRQAAAKAAELRGGAAKDIQQADTMPIKPREAASESHVAYEPTGPQTPRSYQRRPSPPASPPASAVSSRMAGSSVLQTPQSYLTGAGASTLRDAHHPASSATWQRKAAATAEEVVPPRPAELPVPGESGLDGQLTSRSERTDADDRRKVLAESASMTKSGLQSERSASERKDLPANKAAGNAAADSSLPLVYRSAVHAVECFGWAAIHGDTKEWTALHWAAAEGRADICKRLLAAAADPGQPDHTGQSAMTHAQNSGHAEVLRVLQQVSANPRHGSPRRHP